jgi:uroporphyrinogen-III synthase
VGRLASGEVDWLCFFSPSAVESFRRRNFATGGLEPKVAVIGETTAGSARSHGFDVNFISERASAIEFARGLARHIKGIE